MSPEDRDAAAAAEMAFAVSLHARFGMRDFASTQ
jgi:hypothetical protein